MSAFAERVLEPAAAVLEICGKLINGDKVMLVSPTLDVGDKYRHAISNFLNSCKMGDASNKSYVSTLTNGVIFFRSRGSEEGMRGMAVDYSYVFDPSMVNYDVQRTIALATPHGEVVGVVA